MLWVGWSGGGLWVGVVGGWAVAGGFGRVLVWLGCLPSLSAVASFTIQFNIFV